MILKSLVLLSSTFYAGLSLATLTLNKIPPEIKLEGDLGGRVDDGKAWESKDLKGKVNLLFYVAPEAENWNEEAIETLRNEKFPSENFASYAVVNMGASPLLPNWAIALRLKAKQKNNPRTIFVKDKHKTLVKQWGLADHSSDVVVFNKEGNVVYSFDGKLSKEQTAEILEIIKKELAKNPTQRFESKQADTYTDTKQQKQ